MVEPCGPVAVVIPALDEEASIGFVLEGLVDPRIRLVVVADNGSIDGTAAVAEAAGARVVAEPERGYGAACLAGLAHLDDDIETVLFIDADFSDHPGEAAKILDAIEEGHDLVIGSRLLGDAERGALLPQARFGNTLACFLMHRFFGHRFTDLGPFRAIRRGALERIGMRDRAFGWTVEMQVKAVRLGLRICEVPVSYRKRVGVSKITGTVKGTVLAGITILSVIFRSWLALDRRPDVGKSAAGESKK